MGSKITAIIYLMRNYPYYLLIILLLTSGNTLFAQPALTTVEKVISKRNPRIVERYQVLTKEPELRQGTFVRTVKNQIVAEGFYKNNLRDSIWNGYVEGKPVFEGHYKQDERAGVWSFYNQAGNLLHRYDFDRDTLLFYDNTAAAPDRMEEVKKCPPADTSRCEVMPVFLGGANYMTWLIDNWMVYPPIAKENGIQGVVVVSCVVDKTGNTTELVLEKGVSKELNMEALRLVNMFGKIWIPGQLNGRRVKVKYSIPIKFRLY